MRYGPSRNNERWYDLSIAHPPRTRHRHLLRALDRSRSCPRCGAGRRHREGARRAVAGAHPRRPPAQRGAGVPVRAHRPVRHQAVAAVPPHEAAPRCRSGRRRAASQVGLLLRLHRRIPGADLMAELISEPASAGDAAAEPRDIRETVREKYASAARAAAEGSASSSCCGPISLTDADDAGVFGGGLYEDGETEGAPAGALGASLGCGVPTAVADLHEGETVLDLGSGAGADVLISARRVGASGKAIGLDMTDEMLELARANATEAGVANVEFVKGYIEDIPLPDASVDVVISNCVINLAGDKGKVLAEAARVLRPGGRFAVSDVIADVGMDEATRADMAAYTGCIAGALTEAEFRTALAAAGLTDVEIRETHRVHDQASSAIVRARKPALAT